MDTFQVGNLYEVNRMNGHEEWEILERMGSRAVIESKAYDENGMYMHGGYFTADILKNEIGEEAIETGDTCCFIDDYGNEKESSYYLYVDGMETWTGDHTWESDEKSMDTGVVHKEIDHTFQVGDKLSLYGDACHYNMEVCSRDEDTVLLAVERLGEQESGGPEFIGLYQMQVEKSGEGECLRTGVFQELENERMKEIELYAHEDITGDGTQIDVAPREIELQTREEFDRDRSNTGAKNCFEKGDVLFMHTEKADYEVEIADRKQDDVSVNIREYDQENSELKDEYSVEMKVQEGYHGESLRTGDTFIENESGLYPEYECVLQFDRGNTLIPEVEYSNRTLEISEITPGLQMRVCDEGGRESVMTVLEKDGIDVHCKVEEYENGEKINEGVTDLNLRAGVYDNVYLESNDFSVGIGIDGEVTDSGNIVLDGVEYNYDIDENRYFPIDEPTQDLGDAFDDWEEER